MRSRRLMISCDGLTTCVGSAHSQRMEKIDPKTFAKVNRQIHKALDHLLRFRNVRKATVYVSPNFVAKATRQRKPDGRMGGETYLVTVGKPAYLERRFIKKCLKAGVPFPVKKVQLKLYQG